METLDKDYAAGIFGAQEPPCLSLYQPTHRSHPDNQQDPIRFRNLVKTLEESLRREYSTRDVRPLLEPFLKLADDSRFWNHTYDGLAVLGAPGMFRAYRLQRPVPELALVAESFHVKPLLRILQSADRYQVLGLSRQEVKLFEGNRDALDPVELPPDIEGPIAEVLEAGRKQPYTEVHGVAPGVVGATGTGVRHGHASASDMVDSGEERFFRAVDRAILNHYSRPSGLPLLLATLPEHQTTFRRISHNPMLLPLGIEANPDSLSIEALRGRAWQVVEPYYLARLAGLLEMFGVARSKDLGTDDLARAMRSAVSGRVATLLLESDRQVPGRFDAATGGIEFDELANPSVDDLLDDLGEYVLKSGGQVVVVPPDRMPTKTGLAAIYRF